MNCNQIKEKLWQLYAGEMDPDLLEMTEKHIAGCPACFKEAQSMKFVLERLPKVPPLPESYLGSYKQTVIARIEAKSAAKLRLSWGWRFAPVAAAFFLMIGGFFYHRAKERQKIEEIITYLDVLENLEVLERDDFENLAGKKRS